MYYGDSFADLATMRLEGKIKNIYAQAYREIEEKLNTFLAKSVIKEKEYEAKVQAGKLSQEWFDRWKSGQVFIGKRWRDLRQNIAHEIYNSRKSATDMINGERKAVFQDNVNYTQYSIDKDYNFGISFTLYDNATVTRLIKEDPDLVPDIKYPDPSIDYAWSKKQITSAITQGILQGESIPELAKRVGKKLQSSNTASMVRCARTAMTGAQNSGRIQAMHNAQGMGIDVEKLWIATLDGRTRDSHRDLDGQLAKVDEPFRSLLGDIMFPGDPNASPANTWNCRCSLGWNYPRYSNQYDTRATRDVDWEDGGQTEQIPYMTYKEWAKWKKTGQLPQRGLLVLDQPKQDESEDNTKYISMSEEDIKTIFGKRPDSKLRRENREEYDKLRDEYNNCAYKVWNDSLSTEESRAIRDYCGDNYSGINGLCRKQMTEKMVKQWDAVSAIPIKEEIKLVENAINRFELKENIKVYRTCEADVLDELKNKGGVFKDKGFTSTSIFNKQVASGTVDIEINVPAGFGRGAWVQPLSGSPDENEFLLQRGGIYKVEEIIEENNRTKVKMTMLGTESEEVQYATKEEVLKQWKQKGIEYTKDDEDHI